MDGAELRSGKEGMDYEILSADDHDEQAIGRSDDDYRTTDADDGKRRTESTDLSDRLF